MFPEPEPDIELLTYTAAFILSAVYGVVSSLLGA